MTECATCVWYSTLDAADRLFVDGKINEQGVNMTRLYRAARACGLLVSYSAFMYHVRWHHQGGGPAGCVSR